MSNESRYAAIETEVRDLYNFYKANSMPETVRLFKEDFQFLKKKGKLMEFGSEITFAGYRVSEGPPKKKPRKKRPPEFKF